jgi:hypothetical protein
MAQAQRAKIKVLKLVMSVLTLLTVASCANRYREADTGRNAAEVSNMLEAVLGVTAQDAGRNSFVRSLVEDLSVKIYFTEGPGKLGTIEEVAPLDYSIISQGLFADNVQNIEAYFLSRKFSGNSFEGALILKVTPMGQTAPLIKVFTNSGSENVLPGRFNEDDELEMDLVSQNGETIVIRTSDLTEEQSDLAEVIQLEVLSVELDGTLKPRGQLSTLQGY